MEDVVMIVYMLEEVLNKVVRVRACRNSSKCSIDLFWYL